MSDAIRNNTSRNRFELDLAQGVAIASYRASPGTIAIVHTEVPAAARRSGVGSDFVRRVVEEVRRQGLKVERQCSFVRAFMAKNPEFTDLLH